MEKDKITAEILLEISHLSYVNMCLEELYDKQDEWTEQDLDEIYCLNVEKNDTKLRIERLRQKNMS